MLKIVPGGARASNVKFTSKSIKFWTSRFDAGNWKQGLLEDK